MAKIFDIEFEGSISIEAANESIAKKDFVEILQKDMTDNELLRFIKSIKVAVEDSGAYAK